LIDGAVTAHVADLIRCSAQTSILDRPARAILVIPVKPGSSSLLLEHAIE
jgi:hypothetical protein